MRTRLLAVLAAGPLLAACGGSGTTLVVPTAVASRVPASAAAASVAPVDRVTPAAQVEVYVIGAVARPGVYKLTPDSRVQDAVSAAGGFVAGADMVRVNLAARVRDEEEIFIPQVGQTLPVTVVPAGGSTVAGGSSATSTGIDVNTASATKLRQGLGISSTLASKIVSYRKQHGPFVSLDDLRKVPVPDADLQRIRGLIALQ